MVSKVAFIYLTAFSRRGGIEQFNKNVLAALHQSNIATDAISVYDVNADERYFPNNSFKGFSGNRLFFLFSLLFKAKKYDRVFIGHINLAFAAYIFKIINPTIKFTLVAHGIEVWKEQKGMAAWLLKNTDQILAVSNFTKSRMLAFNPFLKADKIQILPNALDPFFAYPTNFEKPLYLLERYGIQLTEKIIVTVARLSSEEQYKGYDQVIEVLKQLNETDAVVKYLIAGKADEIELLRLKKLIALEGLADKVILAGFINENELIDHYLLADVFVLPSTGEGFGIVLIEALACGRKVIAGNKDGSVDALMNGEMGVLINPDNLSELSVAISLGLANLNTNFLGLQLSTKKHFSFSAFKEKLISFIN